MIYSVTTVLVWVFDIFTFCVAYYRFTGVPGHEHADVILLFTTLTFVVTDTYYFTWVMSLKDKLPPEMAAYASDAILGYTKKMSRELWHNLDTSARLKVEEAKNRFKRKRD